MHVSATEKDGKVVFLHKLKDGPADKSYGIHVAELAQLPEQIISRAREILATFEDQEEKGESAVNVSETQLSFFDEQPKIRKELVTIQENKATDKIMKKLKKVNISGTTPLEALQLLYELQKELE